MYRKITKLPGARGPGQTSRQISFYRLRYGNGYQIMVRLPRGAMETSGWVVGDQIDVEFDAQKNRLRLTNCAQGEFRLGGKGKAQTGGQREGRLRWTRQPGRPDIRVPYHTTRWIYRATDNAIVINVDGMETIR